ALDGLAEWNFRSRQFNIDLVPAFQAIADHLKVQLALGGNDRLMQFRIHMVNESWVFFVECSQTLGDLVLVPFRVELQSGMNIGSGIFHLCQGNGHPRTAKGVAGVSVLKLDDRSNIACVQMGYTGPDLPVQNINLPDFFRDLAVAIV